MENYFEGFDFTDFFAEEECRQLQTINMRRE